MSNRFKKAMEFLLLAEGGFTVDNGGPTNYGVTQKTYDYYRRAVAGKLPRPVQEIELREVEDLYVNLYWRPAHCDELGPCLAIAHFDWSVNHGVKGAIETLQKSVDSFVDGVWGPKTKGHVKSVSDLAATTKYMALRDRWVDENQARVNPGAYNGWRNRVHRLWAFICQEAYGT